MRPKPIDKIGNTQFCLVFENCINIINRNKETRLYSTPSNESKYNATNPIL